MSSTVPSVWPKSAEVADAHRLVGDKREAADEILDRFLRAERNGDAADAESREPGGHIEAERVEDGDAGDRGDDELDAAAEEPDGRERPELAALRHACHADLADGVDGAPQEPSEGRPGDELSEKAELLPGHDGYAEEHGADGEDPDRQIDAERQPFSSSLPNGADKVLSDLKE